MSKKVKHVLKTDFSLAALCLVRTPTTKQQHVLKIFFSSPILWLAGTPTTAKTDKKNLLMPFISFY